MFLTVRLASAAGGSSRPMARSTCTPAPSPPVHGLRRFLMPPRFSCPDAAPQTIEGCCRGQADRVTPAARPACSTARRLTPWGCGGRGCGVQDGGSI